VGPAGAKPKADTRLSHRRGCRIRRALIAHVGAPKSMRVAPRCCAIARIAVVDHRIQNT
jgi:hypothetical protein